MEHKRPNRESLVELAGSDPEAIADQFLALWDSREAWKSKVASLQKNSHSSSKPPSSDKGNFSNPPKCQAG